MNLKDLNIPNDWDAITVRKYQEISKIENENELRALIKRISIVTDISEESIRNLNVNDFNTLLHKMTFLNEKPPINNSLTFEFKGKKYGMIPDLNMITTGEWIDIEEFKKDSINNMHLILAVLWREVTNEEDDTYEIKPHISRGFHKRAELFLDLPISQVYTSIIFFLNFQIRFLEIMTDYLQEE